MTTIVITSEEDPSLSIVRFTSELAWADAGPEEVNKVMDNAKTAQKAWAKTPLSKRAELLHKAAAILKEHKAPIAECLVKEIAKPAKDAVTEVVRSGDLISYCAEEGVRLLGQGTFLTSDSFPGNESSKYCLVSKGVVATLHMVHCFHLAGFPKGLISCVTGKGSEIGDFLTMHPGVNCISFTGGDTGIAISKKAGMVSQKLMIRIAESEALDHLEMTAVQQKVKRWITSR